MFFFVSCKGKTSSKTPPPPEPAETRLPEDAPPPVAPPPEKPAAVNPRIAQVAFQPDDGVVEVKRLPASQVPAAFVLYGRFDGKRPMYAYVGGSSIRFVLPDGTVAAEAAQRPQTARLAVGIPGAPGKPDRVLVGWGRDPARRTPENTVVFTATHVGAGTAAAHTVLHSAVSDRADPQDAAPAEDGSILLAWFSDKYMVQLGAVLPDGKTFKPLASAAMIAKVVPLAAQNGDYTLAVSRVYGDQPGSDGGLFLFEKGTWRPLPSVRGVRGLWARAVDGGMELWAGDGWDKDYGKVAKAYLSVVTVRGENAVRRQAAEITGGFSVFDILPCNFFGPQKPGKLLKTNNQLLWMADAAAAPVALASWSSQNSPSVADIDGDGFDEVLIAAPEPMALKAKR